LSRYVKKQLSTTRLQVLVVPKCPRHFGVPVQFSWATSDLWLIQQNKFYWISHRSMVDRLNCTVTHLGTGAKVSTRHFGTSAEMYWVRSVLGPKCPYTLQHLSSNPALSITPNFLPPCV